jgi:hypothetical protein
MTRRVRTTLILQARLPQPPGYSQKQLVEWLHEVLRREGSPFKSFETQVKIVGREVTYL